MKLKIFPVILLFFVSSINAQTINWFKDFKEASQIAVETGKPMMLDFTAIWCKPCQEMEKSFWTRPEVIELAQSFVAVKVNFDNERSLARKYYVSAIPNVTTTDPWGNGLGFNRGFGSNSDKIFGHLKAIPTDFSPIKDSVLLLETDKKNVAALDQIAKFYDQYKLYYQSNQFNKRILKQETDPAKREDLLLTIGLNYLRSSVPDEAEDSLKDFQKEFPQSPKNEIAIFGLSIANIQKDKLKSAEKFLAKLKTEYPDSKYIAQLETEIANKKSK